MTSTSTQNGTDVTRRAGVALLAGGGEGIGTAIARRLAGSGYDLAILDIDSRVDDTSKMIGDECGVRSSFHQCDLSKSDEVSSAVAAVHEAYGSIDVLVHNAGWTPYQRFLEFTEADERRVVEINFLGFLRLCHSVLPGMVERSGGRIVIISSDAARIGVPSESVYSGAKAGLVGFGKALAAEHARHGITVNVVSPGSTDSPMLHRISDEEGIAKRKRANPMRRLASPEDIAGAVGYFVSPDAGYVTGQILSINGGALRVG